MKIKLITSSLIALLILPSCDGDSSSSTSNNSSTDTEATGGTPQQGGEVRSMVEKRVRFVGTSESTSTSSAGGFTVTTTTNSSTDITDEFRSDGVSISSGTVTITSINSSIGAIPGGVGEIIQVTDEQGTYNFTLDADGQTATLISFEEDNAEFVANLTYTSDTTGTYTQISDQTINGVRITTNETGTFEILGSL